MTPDSPELGQDARRVFGDRFRAEKRLKTGQGVDTFLGTDLVSGITVVIKAVDASSVSAGIQLRLEHEAKVLGEIQSRCLSPLLHLGRDADVLYLVMNYIPGVTLHTRLRQGALSVREAVRVGHCLLTALGETHEHGVLHQDVKPANLIVDESGTVQRAILIDFGFARSRHLERSIREQSVGTVQYMSPEQAGLVNQGVSERSDLYSAGIVLYESLAGRPPFQADSVGALLRLHLTIQAPSLRSLGLPVPHAIDALVRRLLRKDPRDRYQSAEAVLADLSEIGDALDRGVSDPAIVVGQRDQRRTLTEPAFIGRGKELAALAARMEQACVGHGGLVLLEAQSGGGKTWLLDEMGQRCHRQGVWVLRGQALDQTAQRPFQMLVGPVGALISAARSYQALAAEIQERVGNHRETLCAALPELAELLTPESSQQLGPETFGEIRTLQALTALLNGLGSQQRPALLLLDDGQWGDELTLKLLQHWQSQAETVRDQPLYVLLVVAFRSEEVPPEHALRTFPVLEHVGLDPFGRDDMQHLVESMAGPVPSDVLHVVSDLSEGNPFMASAVLRGLVESGALVAKPSGWVIEPLALADVQSSRRAATFLARRLDLLPEDARVLLSIGAILGKEFDLDFAAALAHQTPSQAVAAMEEGRRRHIIWSRAHTAKWVFVHDKIRETLLQRLSAEDRKDLHRLAALRFDALHQDRVFDLAFHYDAAGEFERALPYALAAAEQARAQHALEIAEQQYRIAARGLSGADDDIGQRVAQGLGDVLMLRGRYTEAERQFEVARVYATDKGAQAQIEGKLGELAFRRGDVKTASEAIERALQLVDKSIPRSSMMFGVRLLWEVLIQAMHASLPRLFVARREAMGPKELLAIRLYSRLAHAYWFQRGKVPCAWAHLREMNQAERYPTSLELAQAYSEHAPAMTMIPWFSRGIDYAEKSLAIRKRHGDAWGQGQSLHFYGIVLYTASRFEECIEKFQEAMRLFERAGDQWEVNTAEVNIALSLYRLGDLRGAVDVAQRVYQRGVEIGDHQASGMSLGAWTKASGGNVPRSFLETELQWDNENVQTKAEVWQAEARWLLSKGRPSDAAAVLEKAQTLVQRLGLRQEYVSPILPWLATALRQQVESVPVWAPRRRRKLLRRARTIARRAVHLARQYRNNLPHALRESGLVAAMQGRVRRAQRFFDEGLTVANEQGARYEHAQTLLARGQVGLVLGWTGSAQDLAEGTRALASLELPRDQDELREEKPAWPLVTLSLVDRFTTVQQVGRKIASSLSADDVLSAVQEGAIKLLRGDQCAVLKLMTDGSHEEPPFASSGQPDHHYSHTLVQRALRAGRPVSILEGSPEAAAADSLILPAIRSALCAPIFVHGQPVACFYVTHRQVGELFGEDEERLAEFISTLAGAAMENAEGFAELQTAHKQLHFQKTVLECQSEATIDGLLLVAQEGKILSFNHSFVDMWGIPSDALASRSDQAALQAVVDKVANPEEFLARVAYLYDHPEEESREEIVLKDGRTFDRSCVPVRSVEGVYYGRLWHFRDITERKRAEEALRENQARLASIIDAAMDAIITVNDGQTIVLFNAAAETVFRCPAAQAIGQPLQRFIPRLSSTFDVEKAKNSSETTMANGPSGEFGSSSGFRADGEEFRIEASISKVQVGGERLHTIILRDITDRMRAEDALRKAHDELEQRVAGRTKELFQSNVFLRQEILERQRIEEELRARAAQQVTVAHISRCALSYTNLDAFFKEVTEHVANTLNAECSKILELLPDGKALVLRAGVGWKEGCVGHVMVNSGPESQAGYTLLSRQPVIVTDLRTETRFTGSLFLHEHGVISGMSVIIPGENEPFGVLSVHSKRQRIFSHDDIQFLQVIANVVATTIGKTITEQQGDAQHAVSLALMGSATLAEAMPLILEVICRHLDWEVGILWQVEESEGTLRCHTVWRAPSETTGEFIASIRQTTLQRDVSLPGRVWATGQSVWIPDVLCDANFRRQSAAAEDHFHGAFGFPILRGATVSWVMEFLSHRIRRPDEGLLRTTGTIATQIGLFFERIRVEEALRESEERFRTVVETAAEALITIDESGAITFSNRAAEHIFGYSETELRGQPLTLLMPERFRLQHRAGLGRYLATGQPHLAWEAVHLTGLHKSGQEIPLELAFWEFTQQGKRYFSSLIRDITERVQAAEIRTRLLDRVINAQEEERGRIARELHDGTGQSLMALLVGLQAIETAPASGVAQELAREYRKIAAQALDEVRRLAIGLRPSVLDDLGLAPAIERYVTQYTQGYGIAVDIQIAGLETIRLPSTVETALYRIIQEALTNVARHAGASIVSVVIERYSTLVHAIVEDDGCGFDVEAVLRMPGPAMHFGLHGMRERAGLLNGSISIESGPNGGGTTIYVTIPLTDAPNTDLQIHHVPPS